MRTISLTRDEARALVQTISRDKRNQRRVAGVLERLIMADKELSLDGSDAQTVVYAQDPKKEIKNAEVTQRLVNFLAEINS